MTACPAYLGIVLEDRTESSELARYDLLVSCPPRFNATFLIPASGGSVEKTFAVVLDDSHKEHHVYMTKMNLEWHARGCGRTKPPPIRSKHRTTSADAAVVAVLLLAIFAAVLCVTYRCLTLQRTPQGGGGGGGGGTTPSHAAQEGKPQQGVVPPTGLRKRLNRCERSVIAVCVVLQIVHCVLLTFTGASLLLSSAHLGDRLLSPMTSSSSSFDDVIVVFVNGRFLRDAVDDVVRSIDDHVTDQFRRKMAVVERMVRSCGEYFDDRVQTVLSNADESFRAALARRNAVAAASSVGASVAKLFDATVGRFEAGVRLFLRAYRKDVDAQIRSDLVGYHRLVRRFVRSPWLIFAESIFNKTSPAMFMTHQLKSNEQSLSLHRNETDFSAFLGLYNPEFLHLWQLQYWERYLQKENNFDSRLRCRFYN